MLALIGVSCSGPAAMQATEYDDLYYSSSDRTEYAQPQAQAQVSGQSYEAAAPDSEEQVISEGQVLNPEYSSGNRAATANYNGDEYYDGRTYNPRDNWYRPSYSFVDPYWATAVYDPWYPSYSRYSSAYYDPFYDPFLYDPFYRPYYGRGFNVSIALSYGWGNRYPYYSRPYGYGGYGYSRWPYNSYYNGYYNGYHQGYYSGHNYYYDRPVVVQPRKVQYGPRGDRATVPTTGNRTVGRPDRGQQQSVDQQQRVVSPGNRTERPARPERTNRGDVTPGTNTREALPARPNPTGSTEYRRTERTTRQPVNQQPVIEQQRQQQPVQREVRPVQQQERAPRRTRENVPSMEQSQPVRRERPAESRPSYEQPRRESSSPAPSNNSGGGRPRRGN